MAKIKNGTKTLKQRAKHLAINLAVAVFSIIITLLIAEIILQLIISKPNTPPMYIEHDELLGWHKIPNTSHMYTTSEFSIPYEINSQGNRGPEYTDSQLANRYRIVVLGDSFAEGVGVTYENTALKLLEDKLNTPINTDSTNSIDNNIGIDGNRQLYAVINTGTCGYSTDQELLYFRHRGKQFKPQLTIVMLCHNDIWCNSQSVKHFLGTPKPQKPMFKLQEDSQLKLTNVPVPNARSAYLEACKKHPTQKTSIKNWLSDNSRLYDLFRNAIKKNHTLYALAVGMGISKVQTAFLKEGQIVPVPPEYGLWQNTYPQEIQYSWKLTEALLVQLQREVTEVGSKLLIVNVPSQASIYPDVLSATRSQLGLSDDAHPRRIAAELRNICKRHNFDFLDTTDALVTYAKEHKNKRLYFAKDGHWREIGNRVVADLLAKYLVGM